MTVPQKLTPFDLVRLIHRYNVGWCAFGAVLLMLAFSFWIATIYVLMVCIPVIPLPHFESAKEVVSILFLCGVMGIVLLNPAIFFVARFEANFPAIRKTLAWEFASPSWTTFPLTILCLAPILTVLGFATFRQCFSSNSKRIALACTLYAYLNDWGDWVPYPKFESQRQAILLLYQLGLVRISRRFGTLQVKLVGSNANRRKKLCTKAETVNNRFGV